MTQRSYEDVARELQDAEIAHAMHELEIALHCLTMLGAGLAVRKAGLIYFLPLCHDAFNEGNA